MESIGMNGAFQRCASVPGVFAELVTEQIADGITTLFLSGGTLAADCYQALAARQPPGVGGPDWSTVDVFYGDERCVPLDDKDSNHLLAATTLLDVVGPVRSDHPMYRSGPPAEAAAAYQKEVAGLPDFGLVHLGLGPDGHTASLFPESPALAVDEIGVFVVANHDPLGHNVHDRITLTFAGIARARLVVFTVTGAEKHDALARILAGEDLPAGRVTAQEIRWLVDDEAAGSLELPR
jgi:6-phosphogluconolactonase